MPHGFEIRRAAEGEWGSVIWATDGNGKSPAMKFFEKKLTDREKAKVVSLFRRMARDGEITDMQKFKKLDDVKGWTLHEFKSFQIRFLGTYLPGREFIVAIGAKKKKDELMRRYMESAARVLTDHKEAQEAWENAKAKKERERHG